MPLAALRTLRRRPGGRGPELLGLTALGLALAWVAYKAFGEGFSGDGGVPLFIQVTLNGVSAAGLYFLVASGFTLIFGLMRIVNMMHGSLYLLGGYLAYTLQADFVGPEGAFATTSTYGNWLLPLVIASLCAGLVGLFVHQVFLRWNQGQEDRQALITIALTVIVGDQLIPRFPQPQDISVPSDLNRSVDLGVYGMSYPLFRLIVVGVALGVALTLAFVFLRTKFGAIVRAGVDDRGMVSALGVNIQVVFAVAFFLGSVLAGLGGVFGGSVLSLSAGDDWSFLLKALIVVILGGMGSLVGAAVGALALGLVEAYSSVYLVYGGHDYNYLSILLTFALLIFVLALRPHGLFGRPA